MSEPQYIVINTKDRWLKGREIIDQSTVSLGTADSRLDLSSGLTLNSTATHGTYVTWALDSTIAGCVWHRLVVDAEYPLGSEVKVSFAVSDQYKEAWDLRGSWSDEIINPQEVLFKQRSAEKGRYLWLRITLSKPAQTTAPIIRSLKVFFPRVTYLQYLPETYQADESGKEFLERYLSVFETILSSIDEKIKDTPKLLDAFGTPKDFLPWLSTWVGAIQDENWPEDKWRQFIANAVVHYKRRGTPAGLAELIKLYIGKYPIIVERSLLRCSDAEFDKVLTKVYGCGYSFCVLVEPDQVKTPKDEKVLRRIVKSEKPAHTVGGIMVLEPCIRLDWCSYLGKNSYLDQPIDMKAGTAVLPFSTVLVNWDADTKALAEEGCSEEQVQRLLRMAKAKKLCRSCQQQAAPWC